MEKNQSHPITNTNQESRLFFLFFFFLVPSFFLIHCFSLEDEEEGETHTHTLLI